jgi:hypothetical protein
VHPQENKKVLQYISGMESSDLIVSTLVRGMFDRVPVDNS